jgi:glucose/arabinose dehydrogenase
LDIEHFKWIWENDAKFPEYNDNAFQTTLKSRNESSTITIDYINQEVKLRKDSIELNKKKPQKTTN